MSYSSPATIAFSPNHEPELLTENPLQLFAQKLSFLVQNVRHSPEELAEAGCDVDSLFLMLNRLESANAS
ncbi:unnamed protein product [Gemmata massiliana]|uniref:Uncharacterized protein n=1 Tax=Gemmata massiliana TaxID=1210884 RepID=A0A6P2CUU8_9BACT|nr:hypothetical protein [Gemmata massiliana]VTR92136.1 unnamed protein product [Gemmata massiliana]